MFSTKIQRAWKSHAGVCDFGILDDSHVVKKRCSGVRAKTDTLVGS